MLQHLWHASLSFIFSVCQVKFMVIQPQHQQSELLWHKLLLGSRNLQEYLLIWWKLPESIHKLDQTLSQMQMKQLSDRAYVEQGCAQSLVKVEKSSSVHKFTIWLTYIFTSVCFLFFLSFLQIFAFFVVCITHGQYCRFRNTRQSIRLHSFSIIICHVEVFPLRVTQSKCAWAMLDCESQHGYIFTFTSPSKDHENEAVHLWSTYMNVPENECPGYYIDLHIFCMFHITGLK